ncbi:MAG: response regulator [Prolixibacteraceae bacterium]|jgi:two-component system, LytTR family, response regulator LytT|nr:response regulator [Prolixibacteraceae bacterium]MBT6765275.1 response regulator [Prolixibacteraceae bacterium]MBT6997793.1 response regulator [Prolixibacteraceae bacterium]MBT7396802.1 response regulator [Prolixibacteraceae bacterium]
MNPKYKILIVEDELLVATDIEESIESLGYSVQNSVDTGLKAIKEVEKSLPDLILMDINLKGEMSGIEAARRIIQKHDVPIIYLTANADIATVNKAKVALPYGYIIKPFTDKDLQTNIEIAIFKFGNDLKLKMESDQFNTFFDLKDQPKKQFIIQVNKGFEKINIDDVYFVEKEDGQTTIHLFDDEIVTEKLFSDIIGLLPKKNFIQVSGNFVINSSKVFAVKYPEVIIADKMSVITVEVAYKELVMGLESELGEIVDDE